MHYKNGRPAKEGDSVVGKAFTGGGEKVVAGVITELNANAQTCNGVLVYPAVGGTGRATTTIGELLHAEDAFEKASAPGRQLSSVEAKAAYTAYCAAVGGVAFNGDPLPSADEFFADPTKQKQAAAWIAAVEAI